MTEWAAKRFWKEVTTDPVDGGFQLLLDGRPVRTPGKRALVLPVAEMAKAAAEEWAAQGDIIDPLSMPVTRTANSAIDQTAPQREGVIDMLAAYAETDLLCYRAAEPKALTDRQAGAWNPILTWAAARFDAPLSVTTGVLPAPQNAASLANLRNAVAAYGNYGLTGLHDLIVLSGSLILGLAVAECEAAPETAWEYSRIDEDWQIAQWGADEEAETHNLARKKAFLHAARIVHWTGPA